MTAPDGLWHPAPVISAAGYVSLWGDELPETAPGRTGNVTMPGRDTKASLTALATTALAMTIWDLSERGCLSLTVNRRKGLFGTRRDVVLTPLAPAPGFAGTVLAAAATVVQKSKGAPTGMRSFVTHLQGETLSPYSLFLTRAHGDLLAAGALQAEQSSGTMSIVRAMAGADATVPTPEAQRVRGEWEGLKQRWHAWKAANPEVAESLGTACGSSFAAAKQTPDVPST